MTSKSPSDPKDSKRILDVLTGSSANREADCLETDLTTLSRRCQASGLPEFLDDVRGWRATISPQQSSPGRTLIS